MMRGINKHPIFMDEEDNEKFLQVLDACKNVSEFELYGYCLMGNHVHLLLKECKEPLEQIFKRIGSRYVYWYNNKYKRCGHLFQDRFKSEPVENDRYFTVALRYIHQNPVKAGLCKLVNEYKWSSYINYFEKNMIVDTKLALSIIGINNFILFMDSNSNDSCLEDSKSRKMLTDESLINLIEKELNIKADLILKEPKVIMKEMLRKVLTFEGVSTRQLSRVTGVSVNTIWKL